MSSFNYVGQSKPRRALMAGVCAIVLAASGVAQAQPKDTKPTPSTTTTSDYVETNLAGDQVVKFTGDELRGPENSFYGTTIRRPPGALRAGLIRPRLNFVPELLKSVENL